MLDFARETYFAASCPQNRITPLFTQFEEAMISKPKRLYPMKWFSHLENMYPSNRWEHLSKEKITELSITCCYKACIKPKWPDIYKWQAIVQAARVMPCTIAQSFMPASLDLLWRGPHKSPPKTCSALCLALVLPFIAWQNPKKAHKRRKWECWMWLNSWVTVWLASQVLFSELHSYYKYASRIRDRNTACVFKVFFDPCRCKDMNACWRLPTAEH